VTSRATVVVTRRLPSVVEEELTRDFDARLNRDDRPLGAAGLQDALRTADALLCTVTDKLTAEVLGAEPLRARMLANFGVGYNHIDINAAKSRGLAVSNTPDVLTEATADIAMTLLLMVGRRAGEGERHVRCGAWTGWRPTHMLGSQVSGKTLGLIGMGRIARAVAHRAHRGFGMRILFHDPYPPSAPEAASASCAASWVGGSGGASASTSAPSGVMTAIFVPTATVSPSWARICWRTPFAGLGTSVSTLSVEISSSDSSAAIASPSDLSHFVIVPSETETPIWGMTTSTAVPVVAISEPLSIRRAPSSLPPHLRSAG